jgi:signal peptidase II
VSGPAALRRAALVAALALAADQVTKAIVRGSVEPGETVSALPGVDIVRVANDGIAFGLFDDVSSGVLVAIAALFTLVLGWFCVAMADRPGLWLALGLLAGGAIGNLVDRVREGFVTDFIDPPAWPAFNLADIEITVGVLLLAWILLRDPDPGADPAAPAP